MLVKTNILPFFLGFPYQMKYLFPIFLFSCAHLTTLNYKTQHSKAEDQVDLATVYFIRGKNLSGINFVIHDRQVKDRPIGILSSSSFFYVALKPGTHYFSYSDAWKRNKPELEINLEKSKTYYINMTEVKTGHYSTSAYSHIDTTGGHFIGMDEDMAKKILPYLLEIDLEANKNLYSK